MYRAIPQAAEFLEPPTLSKGKTEKTKKKKGDSAKKAPTVDMTSFTSGPVIQSLPSASPEPGEGRINSPTPHMMKASFSRISESASGSGTPVSSTGERTKVAFGFGVKRKAGDEGTGTPPKKR